MGKKCAWCDCHIDGTVYSYTYDGTKWYFCCDKHRQEHKQSHFGDKIAAKRAAEQARLEREKTLRAIDKKNKEEHAYQEAERRKDRSRWYPGEWVKHLIDRPEDAFQCPWDKLTGVELAELLGAKPELAPTSINWQDRMGADDWRSLLIKQPRFAKFCKWAKLDGAKIFEILSENTAVVEYATDDLWKQLGEEMWAALLWRAPDLVYECIEHVDMDKITVAADSGNGAAAYIVSHTIDDDEVAAVEYARKSAEAGCKYGELYYAEILYGCSDPECVKWFEIASRHGMYLASAYLTLIYRFGLFGKKPDADVAWEYAQYDDSLKLDKHISDDGMSSFYRCYITVAYYEKDGRKLPNTSEDLDLVWYRTQRMWHEAYRIINRIGKLDAFLAQLEAAKQYGKKYMDAALKGFLDQDGQVRDDVDDKTKAFIEAYKAAKTKSEDQKIASDSLHKSVKKQDGGRSTMQSPKHEAGHPVVSSPKVNPQGRTVDAKANYNAIKTSKKRWKFVLLGLLFGWLGAHYMYAKRWLMLLLTLGSFATGVVMMNKSESNQKEVPVQTEQQTEGDASKGNSEAIGAVCLVLWLVMWLGGALFVKRDGKGNRM